ncbi:MAG: hypothetical protein HYW65_03725 [Candidatus Liptonbacteria bacterium]|nr:hypothetical protein [Candidatus Liptonbacteria bacterium]
MNPKQFLRIGGGVLVLVGILGFVNVLGPTPEASIFGAGWWFDNGENWAHLIIGIVALIAAYALSAEAQKPLVVVVGIVAVLVGLYSILVGESFLGANLENPADSILHLVVGIWALIASRGREGMG